VDPQLGQFAVAEGRAVGAWPTNDGLTMTYGAWPVAEFHARGDVEGNVLRTLDLVGDRGERVRAGRRAERFRASPDLPNCFRRPWGPGWALVGDAGLVMDPTTGQGIGDALRDAELLADAIGDGLGGRRPLAAALAGYEQARDQAALAMYEFTTELAALGPPSRRCSPPWRAAGRDQSVPRRDHRRGANRLLHSEESAPSPRCPRDGHRDAQQAAPAAAGDSAARGSGKALRPEVGSAPPHELTSRRRPDGVRSVDRHRPADMCVRKR
jgi:2-polyprenyl-6-methoxyphenol hydroxylase-like FAD-dependent oxidoreductase